MRTAVAMALAMVMLLAGEDGGMGCETSCPVGRTHSSQALINCILTEIGQKAPGFSRGMNGSLHSPRPSAILLASLAAHQRRFGAVPSVQASISLLVKPAE